MFVMVTLVWLTRRTTVEIGLLQALFSVGRLQETPIKVYVGHCAMSLPKNIPQTCALPQNYYAILRNIMHSNGVLYGHRAYKVLPSYIPSQPQSYGMRKNACPESMR